MPEYQPQVPDILFSEKALRAAKEAGAVALTTHRQQLDDALTLVESSRVFVPAARDEVMTFVAMYPHALSMRSEKHLHRQPANFPLYRADELQTDTPEPAATYEALQEANRYIVEFRPWVWTGSLTMPIVRRLMGSPPEDATMIAGFAAWKRQAFTIPSRRTAKRIEEAASTQYMHAAMLTKRRT